MYLRFSLRPDEMATGGKPILREYLPPCLVSGLYQSLFLPLHLPEAETFHMPQIIFRNALQHCARMQYHPVFHQFG